MKKHLTIFLITSFVIFSAANTFAQGNTAVPFPKIGIDIGTADTPEDVSTTLQILLLMTILSLAPSILIMTTSYLRLIIVFHFLKTALGTQSMPPSQLLAGIALFITFFIMSPALSKINDTALQPLMNGEIKVEEALDKGVQPLREFMLNNVRDEDIALFIDMADMEMPETRIELPTYILLPAFAISELRAGFIIGFFIFIPFIMVDMIIASILLSMGMMMIPPMMISLPFKILLFILIDGWSLIIGSVIRSFG
ncbi:MAG: flagellar type III secretion system pore protein FliP [Melioribacteraceae bacterium]|nr:flagellar type III secretion system pore protein FliP [Melioribacteraceae bacterium]